MLRVTGLSFRIAELIRASHPISVQHEIGGNAMVRKETANRLLPRRRDVNGARNLFVVTSVKTRPGQAGRRGEIQCRVQQPPVIRRHIAVSFRREWIAFRGRGSIGWS
jgi:hypothetical protein